MRADGPQSEQHGATRHAHPLSPTAGSTVAPPAHPQRCPFHHRYTQQPRRTPPPPLNTPTTHGPSNASRATLIHPRPPPAPRAPRAPAFAHRRHRHRRNLRPTCPKPLEVLSSPARPLSIPVSSALGTRHSALDTRHSTLDTLEALLEHLSSHAHSHRSQARPARHSTLDTRHPTQLCTSCNCGLALPRTASCVSSGARARPDRNQHSSAPTATVSPRPATSASSSCHPEPRPPAKRSRAARRLAQLDKRVPFFGGHSASTNRLLADGFGLATHSSV